MLVRELVPWLALAVALCLVPVQAVPTLDLQRGNHADVVDDASAYVADTIHQPELNASNGYQADAVTVTHQHVDAATLAVTVENTAAEPRFALSDEPVILDAGETGTIPVNDTDPDHPTGTYTVEVRIDVDVQHGDETAGRQTMTREMALEVT